MDMRTRKSYLAICVLMALICVLAGTTSWIKPTLDHPTQRFNFNERTALRLVSLGCSVEKDWTEIECKDVAIEKLAYTSLPSKIKAFAFVKGNIRFLKDRTFANLTSLNKIELSRNPLGKSLTRPISPFLGCVSLKIMILVRCQITVIHPAFFEGLVALTTLQLGQNRIKRPGADWNLPSNFFKLGLQHNRIQSVTKSWNISRYPLKHLWLNNNNISFIEEGSIGYRSLEQVYLQHNKLTTLPHSLQMHIATKDGVGLQYFRRNPWECDCRLVILINVLAAAGDRNFTCGNLLDKPLWRSVLADSKNMMCETVGKNCLGKENCTSKCKYPLQIPINGSDTCGCIPGTKNVKKGCLYCKHGLYQPHANQNTCLDCGEGKMKEVLVPSPMCSCQQNYFTNKQGRCEACPEGMFKNFAGFGDCSVCTKTTRAPICREFFRKKEVTTTAEPEADFPFQELSVIELLKKKQDVLGEKKAAANLLHDLSITLIDVDYAIAKKIEVLSKKKYEG